MILPAFFFVLLALSFCAAVLGVFIHAGGDAVFLRPAFLAFSPDGVLDPGTVHLAGKAFARSLTTFLAVFFVSTGYLFAGKKILSWPVTSAGDCSIKPQAIPLKETAVISLVVLIGLALRAPLMGRGLFYDEIFLATTYLQGASPWAIAQHFTLTDHIGYTFLAFISTQLFGLSEWSMRFPALFLGLGGIVALWYLARRFFDPAVALLSALLLAVAPAHIFWSVSARGYSGYVLCAGILVLLYFEILRRPTFLNQILFVVVAFLGASFHAYCCLFLIGCLWHFLGAVFTDYQNRFFSKKGMLAAWQSLGVSLFLMTAVLLPLTARTWIELAMRRQGSFSGDFPLLLLTYLLSPPAGPILVIAAGLMFLGFCDKRREAIDLSVFAGWMFLMVILVWLGRPYFLYERFWAGLLPLILLLICQGLFFLKDTFLYGKVIAGGVVLMFVVLSAVLPGYGGSLAGREFSGAFKEAVAIAEAGLPLNTPLCAAGPGREFFRFYSKRAVKIFDGVEDYRAFRAGHAKGACLVFNDHASAGRSDEVVLEDLRRTAYEEKVREVSIFFFKK